MGDALRSVGLVKNWRGRERERCTVLVVRGRQSPRPGSYYLGTAHMTQHPHDQPRHAYAVPHLRPTLRRTVSCAWWCMCEWCGCMCVCVCVVVHVRVVRVRWCVCVRCVRMHGGTCASGACACLGWSYQRILQPLDERTWRSPSSKCRWNVEWTRQSEASHRNGLRRRRAPLAGEESRDRMLARFLGLEIPHLNHTIAATAREARAALQHLHCAHIKLVIHY